LDVPTRFEQKAPSWDTTLWEYKADKVTVTALSFAFGQFRLQVWCDFPGAEPDILLPQC
jgi:hypothetical protein